MANSEHDHDHDDLDKILNDSSPEGAELDDATVDAAATAGGRHAVSADDETVVPDSEDITASDADTTVFAESAADDPATEVLPVEEEAAEAAKTEHLIGIEETTDLGGAELDDAELDDTELADSEAATTVLPESSDAETELLPEADIADDAADDAAVVPAAAAAHSKSGDPETELLEEPQTTTAAAEETTQAKGKRRGWIIGAAIALIALVGILLAVLTNGNDNTDNDEASEADTTATTTEATTASSTPVAPAPAAPEDGAEAPASTELADAFPEASATAAPDDPRSTQALETAQSYVNALNMSEVKLREALSTEQPNGEPAFPAEAVDYAMANVQVDYNQEALDSARQYSSFGMPAETIQEQLVADGFTPEQAQFAMSNLG